MTKFTEGYKGRKCEEPWLTMLWEGTAHNNEFYVNVCEYTEYMKIIYFI